jgi:hypothetical protein
MNISDGIGDLRQALFLSDKKFIGLNVCFRLSEGRNFSGARLPGVGFSAFDSAKSSGRSRRRIFTLSSTEPSDCSGEERVPGMDELRGTVGDRHEDIA